MAIATEALWLPLITFTTKKSPMTSVMTKIEPSAIPVLDSGTTMSQMMRQPLLPPSRAASMSERSMRAMELKIGTIMNSVNKCTYAMITAKSENNRNSSGSCVIPVAINAWLKIPFLPRNGIHEIMRMILEVQNGTVHNKNSAICHRMLRTWNARKYDTVKPITSVIAQT